MSADSWAQDRLAPVGTLTGAHAAAINDLIWLDGASAFITCSEDLTIKVWVQQPDQTFANCAAQSTELPPTALAWDGCRQWLFVGLESGHLMVLALAPDFSHFNMVSSFPLHEDRITALRFDPVTDSVVSVSRDRGLCVYNIAIDQTRGGQVSSSWLSALELYYPYKDVPVALCATYESSILLVDCRKQNPKKVHTLNQHGGSVRCLHYDPGTKLLFSSGFDMVIILWRLINTQVKLERKLVGHRKKVNGVVYYAARNRVISAGDDEVLFVWDPNTAKPTHSVPFAHEGAIERLKWVEEQQLLISCGEDLSIKLWKFAVDLPSTEHISQSLSTNAELWKQQQHGDSPAAPGLAGQLIQEHERALLSCVFALRACPNLTLENASWHVQALLSAIDERVRSNAAATEEDVYETLEAAEAVLMSQLRERVFGASPADQQLDTALSERLEKLSFVEASHLEIPEDINLESESFQQAKQALGAISEHRIPREMIDAVVRCCRCIHELIREAKEQSVMRKLRVEQDSSELDKEHVMQAAMQAAASAGADEFLPIFIYVVLVANPPKLHSCLQYVQRFRLFSKMGSEGGCFFTHLSSAVYFLENLDSSSLAIDPAVFEYYLNGCKVRGLRVGEPAIRSTLFEDEADSDDAVVGEGDEGSGGGLFGDLNSVIHQQSRGWNKGHTRNKSNDLFSEDTGGAELGTPSSRSRSFGNSNKQQGDSSQMLAHLLHAMDDDLESDNLFTSADTGRARTGSQLSHGDTAKAAESLLRELELEGDEDEFDFPTKSATQEPQSGHASASGIALKHVAESLADCDNAAANTWDLDDDDLPTPVQWESPISEGKTAPVHDLANLETTDPLVLTPPANSDPSPMGSAGESESPSHDSPSGGVGSARLSAITAMFEQKIAVAEAERRNQHERARQKKGSGTTAGESPKILPKSAAAKDVFFSDLADSDQDSEEAAARGEDELR